MSSRRIIRAAIGLSLALAAGAIAHTKAGPPDQPAPAPIPPAAPATGPGPAGGELSGPRVADPKAAKPSIVEFDFNGKLRPLDVPPEEAALALVTLDGPTKARIDRILAERAAIVDHAVLGNVEVLVQFQSARQSGDRAAMAEYAQQLAKALEPLKARGRLVDEMAGSMPADQAAPYRAAVREYWQAVVDQGVKDARVKGDRVRPGRMLAREATAGIGREIGRSYQRTIAARAKDFDTLLAKLALPPEQEAKVRAMTTDFAQKTRLNPTPAQRQEFALRVLKALEPAERRALAKLIAEQRGAAR